MNRKQLSIAYVLVGLVLLIVAGSRHQGLVSTRNSYQLQLEQPEDTTPLVAVTTVAFGGFRGLVADALWVRANELQDSGQFFELVQLANWITQLEPRIPEVWSFQAWNLAYNISVLFPDPEDRWRWVTHGIHLLRDEGLRHNPTSAALHWDLGWLFQHKIGFDSDDFHFHYKRRWAEFMHDLFHGPRPDYADWPRNPVSGKDQIQDPQLLDLVEQLETWIESPLSYLSYQDRPVPADAERLVQSHPAGAELLRHLRAQRLRDDFGMDIAQMEKLENEVGALDWRMPGTHALYWAHKGAPHSRKQFRSLSMHRMIYQNLANLVRSGELVLHKESRMFLTKPNLDLIGPTLQAIENTRKFANVMRTIDSAQRSFLIDAIILTYESGDQKRSEALFAQLAEMEDSEISVDYKTFIDTTYHGIDPQTANRQLAERRVMSLLTQARQWRGTDDTERADQMEQRAREFYDAYQAIRGNRNIQQRTGLPEFELMKEIVDTGRYEPAP